MSSTERDRIEAALAALEAQRATLGVAVIDAAVQGLRTQLAALDQAALPAPQALKQVTILFLDIVGSTQLSQSLDPEETHAVMDGALLRLTAIVTAHGGKVLQYAGDNLLAVFGAEESREDDPERAVHTGLALLAEGRLLGGEVHERYDHAGFDVRVGVHTGEVLLGGGVDAEGTIRGLAVNIAARMEQSAPAGALRISRETYQHVRGVFDVQPQAPIEAKGVDRPIVTYLVQRAKPRAFRLARRGFEDLSTAMVGRERELAQLLGALEIAAHERRVAAVTVLGEAGLGKSRLIEEYQAALDLDPRSFWLLLGRADRSQRLQPYALLRDMLAWRLQIADSDSAELAKAKLVDGLATRLGPEGATRARYIGQLIGLDFADHPDLSGVGPLQLRDRAFAAFTDYLARLAAEDGLTVVMLIEDLHWADDGSFDLLEHLLGAREAGALAIVMTARPTLVERRPGWAAAHESVHLAPLDAGHSKVLADGLLEGIAGVPEQLRELLVNQAAGNPFYMEELLRMLSDDGVIVEGVAFREVLPEKLQLARVPTTLIGVLQARLDALSRAEREALQEASIVGHVFWDEALAAIDPKAVPLMPGLRDKALVIRRDESAFEGTVEEAFKHHLLQQVTYDTVLKSVRRRGHARAAAWLAARVGDRADEYLAITAEHFERAGDLASAADYYERAAGDAASRFANAASLEHAGHALRCLDPGPSTRRYDLHSVRYSAADLMGLRELQENEAKTRVDVATALGDEALLAHATMGQSLLASRRGDESQALALAERAALLAARSGATTVAAMAQAQLAWSHFTRGEGRQALTLAAQALAAARKALEASDELETRSLLVKILSVQAVVLSSLGSFAQTRATLEEALQRARADGLRRSEASLLGNLGGLEANLYRFASAIPYYDDCLAVSEEIGFTLSLATCHHNLARCSRELGDPALAEHHVRLALERAVSIAMREVEGRCHVLMGHLRADAGDVEAAHLAYELCVARFQAADLPHFAAQGYAGRAALALQAGDLEGARHWAERAHEAAGSGESLYAVEDPTWVPVVCHRVWHRCGDARAPAALAQAYRHLQSLLKRVDTEEERQTIQSARLHREVLAAWEAAKAAER